MIIGLKSWGFVRIGKDIQRGARHLGRSGMKAIVMIIPEALVTMRALVSVTLLPPVLNQLEQAFFLFCWTPHLLQVV